MNRQTAKISPKYT